jgi:TP901 family phage tail tape measure protein
VADRSVIVRLQALVSPYVAGMGKASAATATFAKTTQTQTATANAKLSQLGQTTGVLPAKFGMLAKIGGGALAGVALAGAAAVKKFADFDVAMDAVAASTGATGKELETLGETALRAAADTKFGATDAARGIESLAKAGVSTADIVGGGLKGALDLAAAGEVEVGEAAELAASAMTQFGLAGGDVPHIADLLAAAAGKAQGTVSDMGLALKQSGLVASQMGLSIEETTGTLAAFASAGLTSSDAGTSFRTMLLRLANPAGKAAELMDKLGIAAYDAQGNFVGIQNLAGQLQTQLGGLSQAQRDAALATIFGSDAIRGANVLYAQGAKGIGEWTMKVNDAGFASEQADIRTDNLKGDIERLGGAFESFGISVGETADGPLRWLTQRLENLVELADAFVTAEDNLTTQTLGTARGFSTLADTVDVAAEKEKDAEHQAALLTSEREREAAMVDRYKASTELATVATADQTEAMEELRQEAFDSANAILGLSDANIGYEQSVDDATKAIKDNGKTLDINTQKGRDNKTALDRIAASALKVMEQMYDTGASQKDVAKKSDEMRQELVKAGIRFGMTRQEARRYADQILGIPTSRTTKAHFESKTAVERATALKTLLTKLPSSVTVSLRLIETLEHPPRGGMGGRGFTAGFPLPGGPGAYTVTQGPHDGGAIDYAAPRGTPIMASFAGRLMTTDLGNRSYGKYYTLASGSGRYELGAHLMGFARSPGFISAGQLIGWVDSTGNSTGNHLHLLRNFHRGGVTPGGPSNTLRGEYVVNPAAYAQNRELVQAINAGRAGATPAGDTWIINGTSEELVHKIERRVQFARYTRARVA